MILHTLLAGALTLGALTVPARAVPARAASTPAASPPIVPARAASAPGAPAVTWQECPTYSDDVLRWGGLDEKDLPEFRRLLARTDCGTLKVPRDHADPGGPQITIALTRLRATDQRRRLGSLAVNPGGPGGSGYLMPLELVMSGLKVNERHDLIGFDPRGVGLSTRAGCRAPMPEPPPPGAVSEEQARKVYAEVVRGNRACVAADPGLVGQLTTANVARDLDRIRAALGERRLSFLGVSWGTWLGAVYRSLFPGRVARMWLDSVALPEPRMDVFTEVRAMAADRDFRRMARWIAGRDARYGFGDSTAEVVAALTRLRERYAADPVTFTDLGVTIDGRMVAEAASQPSPSWPDVAEVLKELVDATGPEAPPALRRAFGGGDRPPRPEGVPERQNRVAGLAMFCNEDLGPRTFEAAWDAYRKRLERYPVTGEASTFFPACAGWPLAPRAPRLRQGGGSLVLSGHLHESPSPYEWTIQMRQAVGGHVVTIDDDAHGSALRTPGCMAGVAGYFATGRVTGACPGVPIPD
ncbi:alpha/beta fold hydrolase [Nonomuraea candida]|uniref:alpha/beta fold hydrolase n=1 Tax=Nonomuraea candida TaxID=359159 RepID=UPI000A030FBB|nr:alpha/beta fold hydrolase [Nonomuraea candida]